MHLRHTWKIGKRFCKSTCECDATSAVGNGKVTQKIGIQRNVLRKTRDGRQLGRTELNWLCLAIWRKRRALKREKHLNKIKEILPRPLFSPDGPRRCHPIRERPLGRILEKPENGLRRWIADFTRETGREYRTN